MSILKIKGADGEWVGVTAIKGDKGDQGMSPKINVNVNTDSTYKLRIVTEDKDFITPNLKGSGGSGGSGNNNINATLGTIDNYADFGGKHIPTHGADLPPLPTFQGGTTYVFDHEVRMLVYNGQLDGNGNADIDKYVEYTGSRITIPTEHYGYLTDYVIFNAAPKKSWDTWENPNVVNFVPLDSHKWKVHPWGNPKERWDVLSEAPNLKLNDSIYWKTSWEHGDAWVMRRVEKTSIETLKLSEDYSCGVFSTDDVPFILDEPVLYRRWDKEQQEWGGEIELEWPSEQWMQMVRTNPTFGRGIDNSKADIELTCCYEDINLWGNPKLMKTAESIKRQWEKAEEEGKPRDKKYSMLFGGAFGKNKKISGGHDAYAHAPAMYVGLKPGKNYTIETLSGDCGLLLPNYHDTDDTPYISKITKVCYPTTSKDIYVSKGYAQEVGGNHGGITSSITGGNKLETGTTISYEHIDTTEDPEYMIDIPCRYSCPAVYLNKGESYTFTVDDDYNMYGLYIGCWDEADYQGIKIVEGVEPYSLLMAERLASGATKFNVKVYYTPGEHWISVDDNIIQAEYNIRLAENTSGNDYCRYLNNSIIKHYDLDDFTMTGHQHTLESISDLDDLKATIPKMVLSTSTLVDGTSPLEDNTFWFVYEE